MEDTKFWDIVDEINWYELSNKPREEWIGLQLRLAYKYTKEEMLDFGLVAFNKAKELSSAIKTYCATVEDTTIPYGYGQYGDFCDHVIGLGKDYFYKAKQDPSILEGISYKTSYAYVIPAIQHYIVFESGYFKAQISIFCQKVFDKIANSEFINECDGTFELLQSFVNNIREGQLELLPEAKSVYDFWLGLKEQAKEYSGEDAEELRSALSRDQYLSNLVRTAREYIAIVK